MDILQKNLKQKLFTVNSLDYEASGIVIFAKNKKAYDFISEQFKNEKVKNRRSDFLQKISTKLVKEYDAIVIEDLDLKAMSKRKKGKKFSFGKSISDNGFGKFTEMLGYKLEWAGKTLVKIDKWYPSSQICSECDYKNVETKDLSIREWVCPKCGTKHNRDVNAAKNIRDEGKRIIKVP